MDKLLQLEPDFETTGETRVQLVDRRDTHLYKLASEGALDYIKNVQPIPGHRVVLVLAMSASEYYGANRNGDAFSEGPIMVNGEYAIAPGESLVDWHHTFMQGNVFAHHVNKDPAQGKGKIIATFYNKRMHRVELLVSVDETKLPDVIAKIDGGQFPAVSMGCKIPYDVCSICGNRAPTRAQYCEHVNNMNPMFGMNKLLSDGRRCFVWNPRTNLFDISFVFRPADKIGYTMMKVADTPYVIGSAAEAESLKSAAEKSALLLKLSDIDKIIDGSVADINDLSATWEPPVLGALVNMIDSRHDTLRTNCACPVRDDSMHEMGSAGLTSRDIFNTMQQKGTVPTARDFYGLLCGQTGQSVDPRIAAAVGKWIGPIAQALSSVPGVLDQLVDALQSGDPVSVRIDMNKVAAFLEDRPLAKDMLLRTYKGPDVAALTGMNESQPNAHKNPNNLLHYTDPATGRTLVTTRRAAEEADVSNLRNEAIETGVAAGGLGLSALLLGSGMLGRGTRVAAALPVAAGIWGLPKFYESRQADTINTDEGVAIPANTEFARAKSASQALDSWPYIVAGLIKNAQWAPAVKIAGDRAQSILIAELINGGDPGMPELLSAAARCRYSAR